MEKKKKTSSDWNPRHSAAVAAGAGTTILCMIALGVWCGLKCDEYFGTDPYGLAFFSILGGVTGLWSVIRKMLE